MIAKRRTKTQLAQAADRRSRTGTAGRARRLPRKALEELRLALLAKRADLTGAMTALNIEMHECQAGDDGRSDETEQAAECGEAELRADLLITEWAELQEIEEALVRMEQGTYGICLATGQPIDIRRLRARPWAKYCIEYARQREKERTAFRGSRLDLEATEPR